MNKPWETGEYLSFQERSVNHALAVKRWKVANPDKVRAYNRKNSMNQREKNPEKVKALIRNWYQRNREQQLEKKRLYYQAKKELLKEKSRLNYQKAQARKKEVQQLPRCMSCESILKESSYYCAWCVKTYKYETTRK